MKKIPLIIDTDPGIDDAAAIAIALNSEEIDVKLISSVWGNVDIDNTTLNILKLVTFFNKNVKVAKGCSNPLIRKWLDAANAHGLTGLGDYNFPKENMDLLSQNHSVIEIYQTLLNSDELITIMAIGPLTNIAILLRMFPEIKRKIKQIVIMGGAIGRGNMAPYLEFNMKCDPEAAKIVFESGLKIILAPLEAARTALITSKTVNTLKDINQTGDMFYQLFNLYDGGRLKSGSMPLYDACAIAYILKPELFESKEVYVEIDTQSNISAGQTYIDIDYQLKKLPNTTVLTSSYGIEFNNWLISVIKKCQ